MDLKRGLSVVLFLTAAGGAIVLGYGRELSNEIAQGTSLGIVTLKRENGLAKRLSDEASEREKTGSSIVSPSLSVNPVLAREAASLRRYYDKFLRDSRMSPAQKDQLMGLAAERAWLAENRQKMIKNGGAIANADAFFYAENSRLDRQMRELIGDEYPEFLAASRQIPIQRQIEVFALQLKHSPTPLTPDQQQNLIDIIWQRYDAAGVDFFYSTKHSKITSGRSLLHSAETRSRANALIVADSAAFLSPVQVEKLRAFLAAQVEHLLLSAKLPVGK